MTLIDIPAGQHSTAHTPSDAGPHPHFPSSRPLLRLNTGSMESLSGRIPNAVTVFPTLKKRHSTHALPPSSDPPPTNPPQRRHLPRRGGGVPVTPTKPKAEKRPSIAPGAHEEIDSSPNDNNSPSSSSPVSTRTHFSSAGTGPVEQVTPWALRPTQPTTSHHTLGGPAEEVSPWGLYPVPKPTRNLSSLNTGPVEDVTPWEMFPVSRPEEPVNHDRKSNKKHSRSSGRPSTSSGQVKFLTDTAQILRLKHTNGKVSKARSNTLPSTQPGSCDQGWAPGNTKGAGLPGSVPISPPSTTFGAIRPSATSQKYNFSTADRTILEELKRSISVRAAQFNVKGAGTVDGSGIVSQGKKHHPYGQEEAPYPRSYDREVLDLDVWETTFCQSLCGSLTWHVFETAPARVLDLGCGTGTWILNSARSWRNCQFVGLDIVPLHPDLQQVGSPDLASRITWVQANFLEGLPFPNEEFDFVHVKRIALGVPEDKWDFLLEEISRVMKPEAAFEMLEEDLFFPGKFLDDGSDSESLSSQQSSCSSGICRKCHEGGESDATITGHLCDSGDNLPLSPATSTPPETPSRSGSPSVDVFIHEGHRAEAQDLLSQVYVNYPRPKKVQITEAVVPFPRFPEPVQPQVKPPVHLPYRRGHLPHPKKPSKKSSSAVSLVLSSRLRPDELTGDAIDIRHRPRRRGYSLTSAPPLPHSDVAQRLQNRSQTALNDTSTTPSARPQDFSHFLLRTVPQPPVNPRDHSLLEHIYTQMLESRFINASPLVLLGSSLGLYFKDVRTHPPLQHTFPPIPAKPTSLSDVEHKLDTDSASDSDDARNAILPGPKARSKKERSSHVPSTRSFGSEESGSISEGNRFLDIRDVTQHASQYVVLDDTRAPALLPSNKATFPSAATPQDGKARRGSRLPNTTLNYDLKSLNLHLALRAAEILACSEAMWEWVLEYQAQPEAWRSSSRSILSRDSSDSIRNSIWELTRDDFNGLLSRFDMDMRDKYSLGGALEDRFSWSAIASAPSAERKIFDTACEKWDKWESEQPDTSSARSSRSNRHRSARPATADSALLPSREIKPSGREGDDEKIRKRLSVSSSSSLPSPRRLSRATRVFVAWKA